jgi:hypothetical protein
VLLFKRYTPRQCCSVSSLETANSELPLGCFEEMGGRATLHGFACHEPPNTPGTMGRPTNLLSLSSRRIRRKLPRPPAGVCVPGTVPRCIRPITSRYLNLTSGVRIRAREPASLGTVPTYRSTHLYRRATEPPGSRYLARLAGRDESGVRQRLDSASSHATPNYGCTEQSQLVS